MTSAANEVRAVALGGGHGLHASLSALRLLTRDLTAVVTVADASGRVLAEWGDQATLVRARDANLAPWFCWSEHAVGTNGMGTALETHGPVLIRGAEHWCRAFHNWVCAGVAVREK